MHTKKKLLKLGWDSGWSEKWETYCAANRSRLSAASFPARIATEHKLGYRIFSESGVGEAYLPSRFKHRTPNRSDWPAVGDWVVVEPNEDGTAVEGALRIAAILPRKTCLLRKVAGLQSGGQVLAANVEVVFVVMGLDNDFNLRRLERYLALISESKARAVVILNKRDLCSTVSERVAEVEQLAGEQTPVLAVCATQGIGVELIRNFLPGGSTAALIGSSGAGKSTLINDLLAEARQEVGTVRLSDGKGQHTTVARDLILLPCGGVIIDNPGIREVQLIVDAASLAEAFPEITALSESCRFGDCGHGPEPGCAVTSAIADGVLKAARLENYLELQAEVAILQKRYEARQKRARPPKRRRNPAGRGGQRYRHRDADCADAD